MKKLTMMLTVMVVVVFLASGCAMTLPASRGNFQDLNERVENLAGVVYGNTARISRVESRDNKAIARLRAAVNRCSKRTGQLEDRVGHANPKIYAFWARGFASGSSTLPEKMKAQLDILAAVIKKENISIKKIVGYPRLIKPWLCAGRSQSKFILRLQKTLM